MVQKRNTHNTVSGTLISTNTWLVLTSCEILALKTGVLFSNESADSAAFFKSLDKDTGRSLALDKSIFEIANPIPLVILAFLVSKHKYIVYKKGIQNN